MSQRKMIMLGMVVGSVAGGYLPSLLGFEVSLLASLLYSTIGAMLGICLAYKLTRG